LNSNFWQRKKNPEEKPFFKENKVTTFQTKKSFLKRLQKTPSYFSTSTRNKPKSIRMFPATNNVKHAGRYFEQFVKVAHKSGGSSSKDTSVVKNLPASLYTSPKSKYNSTSTNGQYGQSNGKKNWILIPLSQLHLVWSFKERWYKEICIKK